MEKHSKIVIVGLVISALATLSACGGGGTRAIIIDDPVTPDPVTPDPVTPDPVTPDPVTPDPVTPDPAYASNATDTIAARATMAAASGEAVVLSVANSKNLNYGSGDPTVSDDGAANISLTYGNSDIDKNVVNSIKLETGGGSFITFERGENTLFAKSNSIIKAPFGHWDNYANGTGNQFMIPVEWYMDNNANSKLWSYGVIGHETTAKAVGARSGTASYSGQLFGRSAIATSAQAQVNANVRLNVNFAEGQINNGEIVTSGERGAFDRYPNGTKIDIDASAIIGNGFDSSLSCVAAQCAGGMIAAGSSFAGRFYGNDAQEAGGTASWSWQRGASSNDEDVVNHTVGAVWAASEDEESN